MELGMCPKFLFDGLVARIPGTGWRLCTNLWNVASAAGTSDGSRRLVNDIRPFDGLPDVVIRDGRTP
jgi:hypothetical protein